jgi:hypothetical protein
VVAAGVIALVWQREREPEYQGKKLSQWIAMWGAGKSLREVEEAEAAVHHIGTNGVPLLVRWVTYQRPPWKEKLAHGSFVPGMVRASMLMRRLDGEEAEARADDAALAFHALGPLDASPAVPELCRVVKDGQPVAARRARWVLLIIAPEVLRGSGADPLR